MTDKFFRTCLLDLPTYSAVIKDKEDVINSEIERISALFNKVKGNMKGKNWDDANRIFSSVTNGLRVWQTRCQDFYFDIDQLRMKKEISLDELNDTYKAVDSLGKLSGSIMKDCEALLETLQPAPKEVNSLCLENNRQTKTSKLL